MLQDDILLVMPIAFGGSAGISPEVTGKDLCIFIFFFQGSQSTTDANASAPTGGSPTDAKDWRA